jgi:ADP-ribose pyrophosphatase YjhB (NUDIX family)
MNKIIIASGPVIVEDGKVLLNQHGDTPFWKFCGGKVESMDMTLKEAAAREAKEEIGVELDFQDEAPFVMHTVKKTDEGDIDVLLVHFLAKRIGDVIKGADIREVAWHDINNLPEDLAPNIIPTLKHFGYLS